MNVRDLTEQLATTARPDMEIKIYDAGWLNTPTSVGVEFDDRDGKSVVVIR